MRSVGNSLRTARSSGARRQALFRRRGSMGEYITVKRWRLKDGREEAELLRIVRRQIEPHYQLLSGAVRLGLWRIGGSRSYFAVQYWRSRADWEAAATAVSYRDWWKRYEAILKRWDEVMEFEDEWNAEELLS